MLDCGYSSRPCLNIFLGDKIHQAISFSHKWCKANNLAKVLPLTPEVGWYIGLCINLFLPESDVIVSFLRVSYNAS